MGARPLCGRPLSGAGPLGFCPQFREDGAVSREGRLWPGPRGLGRMRTGSPAPNCLCFASPLNDQPLPPAPVTSAWLPPFLLHVTVTCGDPVFCLFLMQPDCPGRDASVQVAVEKLQEENRLLKQKVTHVSVRHSSGKKPPCELRVHAEGWAPPLGRFGRCTWPPETRPFHLEGRL